MDNSAWKIGDTVSVNLTGLDVAFSSRFQNCLVEGTVVGVSGALFSIRFGKKKVPILVGPERIARVRSPELQRNWNVGDKVEVKCDGNWWEATIAATSLDDGKWKVCYLGNYEEPKGNDELIELENIRSESTNSTRNVHKWKIEAPSSGNERERQLDVARSNEQSVSYEEKEQQSHYTQAVDGNGANLVKAAGKVNPPLLSQSDQLAKLCFSRFFKDYEARWNDAPCSACCDLGALLKVADELIAQRIANGQRDEIRRRSFYVSKILNRVSLFSGWKGQGRHSGQMSEILREPDIQEWFLAEDRNEKKAWVMLGHMAELPKQVMKSFFYDTLTKTLSDLDDLIGLDAVKAHVRDLLVEISAQISLNGKNKWKPALPMQILFLGAPGTGKTEMAAKMPTLYWLFGALKYGQFWPVTASSLEGSAVGEATPLTLEALSRATEGCLFLDEAYSLDVKRFGKQVISTLLANTPSSNRLLIAAGYEDFMNKFFLGANPGVASRFEQLKFPDYTVEQVTDIIAKRKTYGDIYFSNDTADLLRNLVECHIFLFQGRAGNARAANKLLQLIRKEVLRNYAAREKITVDQKVFYKVCPEDLSRGFRTMNEPDMLKLREFFEITLSHDLMVKGFEKRTFDGCEYLPWSKMVWPRVYKGNSRDDVVSTVKKHAGQCIFISGLPGSGKTVICHLLSCLAQDFCPQPSEDACSLVFEWRESQRKLRKIADIVINISWVDLSLRYNKLCEKPVVDLDLIMQLMFGVELDDAQRALFEIRKSRILWLWDGVNSLENGDVSSLTALTARLLKGKPPSFAPFSVVTTRDFDPSVERIFTVSLCHVNSFLLRRYGSSEAHKMWDFFNKILHGSDRRSLSPFLCEILCSAFDEGADLKGMNPLEIIEGVALSGHPLDKEAVVILEELALQCLQRGTSSFRKKDLISAIKICQGGAGIDDQVLMLEVFICQLSKQVYAFSDNILWKQLAVRRLWLRSPEDIVRACLLIPRALQPEVFKLFVALHPRDRNDAKDCLLQLAWAFLSQRNADHLSLFEALNEVFNREEMIYWLVQQRGDFGGLRKTEMGALCSFFVLLSDQRKLQDIIQKLRSHNVAKYSIVGHMKRVLTNNAAIPDTDRLLSKLEDDVVKILVLYKVLSKSEYSFWCGWTLRKDLIDSVIAENPLKIRHVVIGAKRRRSPDNVCVVVVLDYLARIYQADVVEDLEDFFVDSDPSIWTRAVWFISDRYDSRVRAFSTCFWIESLAKMIAQEGIDITEYVKVLSLTEAGKLKEVLSGKLKRRLDRAIAALPTPLTSFERSVKQRDESWMSIVSEHFNELEEGQAKDWLTLYE